MQRKRVIVALGSDEYRRLEQWGQAEERAPDQQATWLLRRALEQLQIREVVPLRPQLAGAGAE